jgi:hypothetical protein
VRNKSQIIVLIASLALAVILVLIWRLGSDGGDGYRKHYSYDWDQKFKFESKDPKGLYLFFSLLKFNNPQRPIYEINSPNKFDSILRNDKNGTFLFIGDTIGLLNRELKLLLKKWNNGSTLFFSCNELGSNITDSIFRKFEMGFIFDESATFQFNGEKSKFYGQYQNDTIAIAWNGIKEFDSKLSQVDALIRQNSLATLIRMKDGEKTMFFQSNPEPFLNYQLKSKEGFKHANFVINQLPKKNPIYFVSIAQVHFQFQEEVTQEEMDSKQNLLELILNNRILLNTMVLTLLAAILFVVFRSKRRRAIIPIIQKQEGITRTFVETIASIFLNKQNPFSVLQIQRKNFYDTILRCYYIDLQRNKEENTLELLSEKTGYPLEKIKKLLKELRYENQAIGNDYIQKISKLQQDFYRHCGIIVDNEQKVLVEFEISRNIWISTLLLIFGITVTFLGLYMLVNSNGIGVLFWIIGFLILTFGIIRIVIPHFKIHQNEIVYFNHFGFRVKTSKPIKLSSEKHFFIAKIENKDLIIQHWDIMQNDIALLKRFIQQTKNL